MRLVKMALVPNSLGPGHVDSSVKRVVVSTKTLFPKYIYIVRYLKEGEGVLTSASHIDLGQPHDRALDRDGLGLDRATSKKVPSGKRGHLTAPS